jgi:hypothetical protein
VKSATGNLRIVQVAFLTAVFSLPSPASAAFVPENTFLGEALPLRFADGLSPWNRPAALPGNSQEAMVSFGVCRPFAINELALGYAGGGYSSNRWGVSGAVDSWGWEVYRESRTTLAIGRKMGKRWSLGTSIRTKWVQIEHFRSSGVADLTLDVCANPVAGLRVYGQVTGIARNNWGEALLNTPRSVLCAADWKVGLVDLRGAVTRETSNVHTTDVSASFRFFPWLSFTVARASGPAAHLFGVEIGRSHAAAYSLSLHPVLPATQTIRFRESWRRPD